jgi:hypothetical protein
MVSAFGAKHAISFDLMVLCHWLVFKVLTIVSML